MARIFPSMLHVLVLLLLLGGVLVSGARSAGSDPKPKAETTAESLYNEGVELSEEGRHAAARVKFEKAHEMEPEDADILNMLAFSLRKTGDLEGAFELYEEALEQRERFPQAREYLGEAHIQAALIQIQTLQGYGPEAEEELQALLDALKRAANQVAGGEFELEPANW